MHKPVARSRGAAAKATGEASLGRLASVVGGAPAMRPDVPNGCIPRALFGVQLAFDELVCAKTVDEIVARAPAAACHIGFSRILYSRVDQGIWLAQTAHAVDDPGFAERLLDFGIAHSRRLTGWLVEAEMLLTGQPIIVEDAASNPRVHRSLIRFAKAKDYVAAPVQAWGSPVAMVHADRYPHQQVDDVDRRLLGLYAQGLGLAIERAQMVERLQLINHASSAAFPDAEPRWVPPSPLRLATVPEVPDTERLGDRLSPREWDVLRDIALGRTNAQIAAGLFLAEGTVKFHVKRILRKLGAANRTEAATLYHRLTRRD